MGKRYRGVDVDFCIQLGNMYDAAEVAKTCAKLEFDADICSRETIVDAKSILGVVNLGYSVPLGVRVLGTPEQVEELKQLLVKYLVKE